MKKIFSKSLIGGLLLAFAGGSIDAYTYICRGGVFASMQTGNLLKLGIGFINGGKTAWYLYIIPVIFFSVGVIGSEVVMNVEKLKHFKFWKHCVVATEILILLLAAFLPMGKLNVVVNSLISLFCAMQYNCFRKLDSLPIATTMCTGNLRSLFEQVSKFFIFKNRKYAKNAAKYLLLILFFVVGATVTAALVKAVSEKAVILSAAVLSLFLIYYSVSGVTKEL